MGLDSAGKLGIQIYWVMGRSENSRNRVLKVDEATGLVRTDAFDWSKVTDPSLIIYNAMTAVNGHHIVSNGNQRAANLLATFPLSPITFIASGKPSI